MRGWVPEKIFNDSESDDGWIHRYSQDYTLGGIEGKMYYEFFHYGDSWENDIFISCVGWETNDDTYADIIKNVIIDMSTDDDSYQNEPEKKYDDDLNIYHEYEWYHDHELVNDDTDPLYMVIDGHTPKIILQWS